MKMKLLLFTLFYFLLIFQITIVHKLKSASEIKPPNILAVERLKIVEMLKLFNSNSLIKNVPFRNVGPAERGFYLD